MADERIDIEVIDKVASTIRPELLGIAAAAKAAHPEITKLKSSLSGMNMSGMASFRKMASDANALAVSTTKLDTAQTKAAMSAQKLAQAEAKTALAQEKVRTQAARTAEIETRSYLANEKALNSLVAAESSATAAKQRTAAASVKAAAAAEKEAASVYKAAHAYDAEARAAMAQTRYNSAAGIGRSTKSAKDSFAVFEDTGHIDKVNNSLDNLGKKAELGRHHLLNLGFQLQDIFVSLASGQKPLTVFIQQGGQIGQIAAQSGVGIGGMAKAVGGLLLRFAPLAIAAGVVAAGFALFNRQIEKDAGIKAYSKTLGLTAKEIKKLDDVSVTFGDTAKAVFQVAVRNIAARLGIDTKAISKTWNSFLDGLWKYTRIVVSGIYASFAGMAYGVNNIVKNLGDGKANDNPFANVMEGYKEAYSDAQGFFDDISKQAGKNARERLAKQAKEIKGDRSPKAKSFDRAKELREVNAELDAQIKLSKLYGDELERQTKLEEIGQIFRKNGVALSEAEQAALLKKINAIRENARVQEQMNRMYEEVKGPQREYEAGLKAADKLLDDGVFTLERYNKEVSALERNLDNATKPLAGMTRELDKQAKLVGKFGDDRAIAEYIQQMEDAALAMKQSIYKQLPAANDNGDIVVTAGFELTDEAKANLAEFKRQLQQAKQTSFVEDLTQSGLNANGQGVGGNQWILDNQASLYEQIDAMRKGDVESERNAAAAKAELDKRYLDARLANTSSVLGQLTGLASSENRKLATIGKAAAIAQATMDAYRAINMALATLPPPFNIAMAAAIGATAFANVASIAGVKGFEKGGYTGDGGRKQVAGAVHGQEYVMDAAATKRIGVGNLDAMRSGRLNPPPAANNNAPKVTVINNAGAEVQVRERSDGELELMVDRRLEAKFGDTMQRHLSNPNSKASQSVSNSFNVRRKR